jgi:hypothetical protein
MGRPKKDKDEWADLDPNFKSAIDGMSREQIQSRLGAITFDYVSLMVAKKLDQDLEDKKQIYDEANEVYKNGTKDFKLQSKYCKKVLDDKGGKSSPKQ